MSDTTELLVLQPTPFCNIDCRYCYLPSRGEKAVMSREVVEAAFTRMAGSFFLGPDLTVLWHAGEPLVVKQSFYEEAMEFARSTLPATTNLAFNFQTNATLITEHWLPLFASPDVSVCISLDGPKEIHDRSRRDRAGRGTFDATMRGLHLLKRAGIDFSIIAVVTAENLKEIDRTLDFFANLEPLTVGLNLEAHAGTKRRSAVALDGNIADVRAYHARVASRYIAGLPYKLRDLDHRVDFMKFGLRPMRPVSGTAGKIINIDHKGNFSTFAPEIAGLDSPHGRISFGNVLADELSSMLHNDAFIRINAEIRKGWKACKETCAYWTVCGGGNPADKLFEALNFSAAATGSCRMTEMLAWDCLLQELDNLEAPLY